MTRPLKIILAIVALIVGLIGIWWAISALQNRPADGVIKDKDTNEVFDTTHEDPQTGGGIAKQSSIRIFGSENLAKQARDTNGKTGRYVLAIQEAIWSYSSTILKDEYPTITIRPQTLSITKELIKGEIRVGQTDIILPLSAEITPTGETAVVVINKGGTELGGDFVFVGGITNNEQFLFEITQKDTKSTDLIIKSYGGYRQAALKYLASLGYHVPDFSITFEGYESVF